MMTGVMDGVMAADGGTTAAGVMLSMAGLPAVAADGVVMKGTVVADMHSLIPVTAADTITADRLSGHRISLARSCNVIFDAHPPTRT
jgi:hypothetical protein